MARDNDRMTARLFAISSAKPVTFSEETRAASKKRKAPREPRTAVFRAGRLSTRSGSEIACVVKDINDHGARVRLEGALGLPDEVIIRITQTGAKMRARVAWQDGQDVGLAFIADLSRKEGLKRSLQRSKLAAQ